jgi:DNA helicase-2/ATP-dependent DNA helicase PcrA
MMNTRAAEGVVTALVKIFDELKSCHGSTEDDVRRLANRNIRDKDIPQILAMYNEYNKELIAHNVLDYEDQLRLLLDLNKTGLFATLGYQHVIVDEFQDSDPNQIEILVQLAAACNATLQSLVVVGDELQAIYGFRNATPDNLTSFDKYFPGMKDVTLADNFRSETPIIALANHMTKCIAKIPKAIISHSTAPGKAPVPLEVADQKAEDDLFTKQIKKLLANGMAPSDIAVLCATRKELIHFQQLFDKAGIPTVLRVPKVVGDEPFVKAIIALASYLKDNSNMCDLALYAKSMGGDPFDEAELAKSAKAINDLFDGCATEEKKIGYFFSLIQHCREDYIGDYFAQQLEGRKFHTLRECVNYCCKYRDYDTKEMVSTTKEKSDCVSLITVHSAKGLEWHTVLLSMRGFRYSTEAERLLYVAATRAKSQLLITYTEKQAPFKRLLYP